MKRIPSTLLALSLFAAAPAALAAPPVPEEPAPAAVSPGEEAFFRAFYREQGLRDFADAADLYAAAASAAEEEGNDALRLKSLAGRARCLAALRRADESTAAWKAVQALDPENAEAREALAASGPAATEDEELDARLRGLVEQLASSPDPASRDLYLVGDRAVPALEEGLRSRHVGIVSRSALVLGEMGTEASMLALARALEPGETPFVPVVLSGVRDAESDDPGWAPVVEVLARRPELSFRLELADFLSDGMVASQARDPALVAAIARFARDESPAVRARLFEAQLSPEAAIALRDAAGEMLSSEIPSDRFGALGAILQSKELAVAFAVELRSLLRDPDPALGTRAFLCLDRHGLVAGEERDGLLCGFLGSRNFVLAGYGASVLDEDLKAGRAPGEATARAYLEALPRVLAEGGENLTDPRNFLTLIHRNPPGRAFPDDAIFEAHSALTAEALPKAAKWLPHARGGLFQALIRDRRPDPEADGRLAVEGFRKQASPEARREWMLGWLRSNRPLAPEAASLAAADEDPTVRWAGYLLLQAYARRAQGAVPARPLLPRLGEDLHSPLAILDGMKVGEPLRNTALELATRWPHPEIAPAVLRLYEAEEEWYRNSVYRPGDRDNEPLLTLFVKCAGKDALPQVRGAFRERFTSESRNLLVELLGMDAVPELLEAVDRGVDPWVSVGIPRDVFHAFLDRLSPEKYSSFLVNDVVRILDSERATPIVLAALRRNEPDIQVAAAKGAKTLNLVDAWPRLLELLDSPHKKVRDAAGAALLSLRSYRDLKGDFERFGKDGPVHALESARARIASDDPVLRRAAALALGALGNPSGVADLLALLDDSDASVKQAALDALERLGGKPPEPR